jgi:hypothetical protein
MPSSGMLGRVALVRTSELVLVILMMEALVSFETLITRARRRIFKEDGILQIFSAA